MTGEKWGGGDRRRVQQRDVGGDVIERKLQEDISGNCPSHPMCDKIKADSGSAVVTPPNLAPTSLLSWWCRVGVRGGSNVHLLLIFVVHQQSFTTFHRCINEGTIN